ncbi:hypothetical protein [Paenibacillus arenilitoris]|uniref:DUF4386 family protein n=1 Tax=Paenibacillus arenilitoris TaxID=2772299 RepID=A0A927CUW8_9BACL|nr:hypothetical protein [Paenibacillus arenilitoris]MBD2872005.1 hypothetical protein [Paenibacillus arenilitoris]
MTTNHQTAVLKGSEHPLTDRRAAITAANLIRCAGLSAILAGILFIVIQMIHPIDTLSAVVTDRWVIVHILSVAMTLFGLLGVTGIYARQTEQAGWLGLAGYLLFSLFFALTMAFQFAEAFISPVLASEAPQFVEGFLGIVSGTVSESNIGDLDTVYSITGVMYLLGGLLFGIATLRAGILSRWAAGMLAFGTVLPLLLSSLVHHPYDRVLAVPVGLSLAWLGYSIWSERREKA